MPSIRFPSDAVPYLRKGLEWDAEYSRMLLLKGADIICCMALGGGYDSYEVGITEEAVFAPAIDMGAGGVILAHTHPASPYPIASDADIRLTTLYTMIGERLGIRIRDHIILTRERYLSFQEAGLMRIIRESDVPTKE